MQGACWKCGETWASRHSPGFREECLKCGSPWHCCRNCRFFAADASQWCREPLAREARPRDPEPSNVCEHFMLAETRAAQEPKPAAAPNDWQKFERQDRNDIFKK